MRHLAAFAFIWLLVGFTTGTAVLLGPVRWATDVARDNAWSESQESLVVRGIILLFVAGSALVALWLTRIVLRTPQAHVRFGIPSVALVATLGTLGIWLSPGMLSGDTPTTDVGSSFTFGPYPTEERMQELQAAGYTTIISLLHPAVAPFETKLIGDGSAAASRTGLEFLHVPMLPWVSDNREALDRIEALARAEDGRRYYVHCYLGKDRVRLVMRAVEQTVPSAHIDASRELQRHAAARDIADVEHLERGEVVRLADRLHLIPFPTDDEFMSYVLTAPGMHVVSLLDPENPEDRPWVEREQLLCEAHRVPFELRPIAAESPDPQRVLELAREVSRMPRPLVVHAFLAPGSGRAPAAEAFVQAFRSDLPPLPPALFVTPLAGGALRVLAPNVAAGPRPEPTEFAGLARRGVRELIYLGPADGAPAGADRLAAEQARLGWQALAPQGLPSVLGQGGPWYLYGPGLAAAEPEVARTFGPAIPFAPGSASAAPAVDLRSIESIAGFIDRALPDLRTVVLLGPILLLGAAGAAAFAAWLRVVREVRAPYTRKVFHFLIFTSAGVLHLSGGLPSVVLFGAIVSSLVLYAVFRGEGFPFYEALARPTDAPLRTLFVLVPLATTALGGVAANLLFGSMAPIGYLVCGWGDAVGEPVGTAWGRHRYRVPSLGGVPATRSLEGSAAVFVVGTLAAGLGLALAGSPLPGVLPLALACGLAGALIEAVSNHGLDNLTVQLAASGTAWFLLG